MKNQSNRPTVWISQNKNSTISISVSAFELCFTVNKTEREGGWALASWTGVLDPLVLIHDMHKSNLGLWGGTGCSKNSNVYWLVEEPTKPICDEWCLKPAAVRGEELVQSPQVYRALGKEVRGSEQGNSFLLLISYCLRNGTLYYLTRDGQDGMKKYLTQSLVLPENNLQDPVLGIWPRKSYFCSLVLWLWVAFEAKLCSWPFKFEVLSSVAEYSIPFPK